VLFRSIGAEGAAGAAAVEAPEVAEGAMGVSKALEEAVMTSKAAGPARAVIAEHEAVQGGKAVSEGLEAALPGNVEKAIIAEKNPHLAREALRQVEEQLASTAGESGVSAAVPSLSARVLGRLPDAAKQAQLGLGYSAIELTNEKDLGRTPEEVASHVMGSLFWGAVGGAAGGEIVHGVLKAASPLVEKVGAAFGKSAEALDNLAAALKVGDGEAIIKSTRGKLQGGLDAMDQLAHTKTLDKAMEAARKKVGDSGMKDLDAGYIKATEAYADAKANVLRQLGINVTERGDTARKISSDKVAKALRSESRDDVLEALQKLHEAGKGLQDFHEELAKAGATGLEGLSGTTKEQVQALMDVQAAMKAGLAESAARGGVGEAAQALFGGEIAGGIAEHFGHHILGKLVPLYGAARAAKMLWQLAPAEFKAARLAALARLSEGVDGHLDRIASAMWNGGAGKFAAAPVAAMSGEELHKLRDEVNQKLSNPQLAQDHLERRAGVLADVVPEAYGQMAVQYGQQLQTLAGILKMPEPLGGPFSQKYQPSESERAKMALHVAIVKDPKVFEANLAKGTATAAQVATYKAAHGPRAEALTRAFLGGLKEGRRADAGTLKAMTGAAILGITPRSSYSPGTIAGVQGIYALKGTQQGGPGSRGGTGGAKALSANQMVSLPGQRVAQRPVK